jgi:hypothetical protein
MMDLLLRILGLKASGFLSMMLSIACCLIASYDSLLLQVWHVQEVPEQYLPLAKHSQYNLRHFEFLQLHLFPVVSLLALDGCFRSRWGEVGD